MPSHTVIPLDMLPVSSLILYELIAKLHKTPWERWGSLQRAWGDSNYQTQDGSAARCCITPCHKTLVQAQFIYCTPCTMLSNIMKCMRICMWYLRAYDACVCACMSATWGQRERWGLISVHCARRAAWSFLMCHTLRHSWVRERIVFHFHKWILKGEVM